MDLQPADRLGDMLTKQARAFGVVHGCLDLAIQAACAKWVHDYPDLREVNGNVLAGTVRQCLIGQLRCPEFKESALSAKAGVNCSVILSDAAGSKTCVRKHPRNYTGKLLRVTNIPANTLFGIDYSACPWPPYILWDADLKTQALKHAWLAAVADIDEPGLTAIYARYDLPPAIMPQIAASQVDEADNEDWDAEFAGIHQSGADDPA